MCRRTLVVLVLACGGCSLLLGLESPEPAAVDARAEDGAADPLVPDGDVTSDASANVDGRLPIDASADVDGPPPIDGRLPIDASAPCVPINDMNECTYDICTGGIPANPPVPRDTPCHNGADQCDGAGHCVDCTNNGGCGECCICSPEHVCIPF